MVLAVRLEKKELMRLTLVSKKRHLNRSQAAKELLMRGFLMYLLEEYKAGNLSLGKLAEDLDMTALEALSLVSMYNAHPRVPKGYLAEAHQTVKRLFR